MHTKSIRGREHNLFNFNCFYQAFEFSKLKMHVVFFVKTFQARQGYNCIEEEGLHDSGVGVSKCAGKSST